MNRQDAKGAKKKGISSPNRESGTAPFLAFLAPWRLTISDQLSRELLQEIDTRIEAQQRSRSEFIEEAVRTFLAAADRAALRTREAALLRKHAAALNAEMAEILEYQALP